MIDDLREQSMLAIRGQLRDADLVVASAGWRALERDFTRTYESLHTCPPKGPEAGIRDGDRMSELFGLVTKRWVDTTTELLRRVRSDRMLIGSELFEQRDPGCITAVRSGLGDRHHGGRTVVELTFEHGLRLVYKPRPVTLLAAWGRLVRRIEHWASCGTFELPKVLERRGYGWVSWVDEVPCARVEEIPSLYRKMGVLLALAYVLGATDLHAENLVVHGDSPVLVDAETILHVDWQRPDSVDVVRKAAFEVLDRTSVLRTGILPRWQTVYGRLVDSGGVRACGRALSKRYPQAPEQAWSYASSLLEGFAAGYRTLSQRQGEQAVRMFLVETAHASARAVRRPSYLYQQIRSELAASRTTVGANVRERSQARVDAWYRVLSGAELTALSELDIPRFELGPKVSADVDEGEILRDRSLGRFARERLEALSEEDLVWQAVLVSASLSLQAPATLTSSTGWTASGGEGEVHGVRLIEAAEKLARYVTRWALEEDGCLFWLTRQQLSRHCWRLAPADFGLYEGNTGIAVFLAALGVVSGEEIWIEEAKRAIHPVGRALAYDRGGPGFVSRFGVGGASGLGGVLFGMATLARLTSDARSLAGAVDAAVGIARSQPKINEDFLYGTPGLIAGLLAAFAVTGHQQAAEAAVYLGQRLLSSVADGHRRAFAPSARVRLPPCLGGGGSFAHGAVGVAAVCGLLARIAPNEGFDEASKMLLFASTSGAKRAIRSSLSGVEAAGSWCSGMTGALAATWCRPQSSGADDDVHGRTPTADSLVRGLLENQRAKDHTLCCGVAGRVDVLTEAYSRGVGDEVVVARTIGSMSAALVDAVEHPGDRGLLGAEELWPISPGLYAGLSGVGYALLRVASPHKLPAILGWNLLEDES